MGSPPSGMVSRSPSGRLDIIAPIQLDPSEPLPFMISTPTSSAVVTPRGEGVSSSLVTEENSTQILSPPPVVLRLSEVITKPRLGATSQADATVVAAASLLDEFKCCSTDASSSSIAGSTTAGSGTIPLSTAAGSGAIPSSEPSIAGDATRMALERPVLGSAELPSRGSALHRWAACKPCAFVFAEGCMNDINCQFCHLCEPGERKRRRKERRKLAASSRDDYLEESSCCQHAIVSARMAKPIHSPQRQSWTQPGAKAWGGMMQTEPMVLSTRPR